MTGPLEFVGPGGMRILACEDHTNPVTALSLCFVGGVPWEHPGEQGLTNLVQRLLVKGTTHRTREEIADGLEFLGAAFTPFAYKDLFGANLSLLTRNFTRGLEILADCLRNPVFEPIELVKEKRMVELELERLKDDSLRLGGERVESLLFQGHPYRYLVLGQPQTVEALGVARLRQWHAETTDPGRLAVAVVGDMRPKDMADAVTRALDGWKPAEFTPPEWPAWEPPVSPLRQDVNRDKHQAVVVVAQAGPSFLSPDYLPFQLLNTVLAGLSGRLFAELRDRRGLGYLVNSQLERRVHYSCLKAYLGTHPDRLEEGLDAIRHEFSRLTREPVSQEELYRAKRYVLGLYEIRMQKKSYQAYQLAYHLSVGSDLEQFERFPERVRSVTAEQMLEVARRYLNSAATACVRILPG